MTFLSPFLLPGLIIASVPILIHLLNRRRFTVVDWAPMKYLKLTIRTNRRRMQIEQLILLALRTLLMILLILTVARLALSKSALSGFLAKRSRVSRVIVLDDSLAMGYRSDGKSDFDRGKQAAGEILHNTGAQDAVTFLTTAPQSFPLIKEASLEDSGKLLTQLQTLQTTDAAANWTGTFKTVDDALSTATFPDKQLIIITALRKQGWGKEVTDIATRWAAKGIEARIVDVGPHATANVSLLKFSQDDPLVLPGVPVKLTATIRNDTLAPISGAQAALSTDGQTRPVILPELPAGATVDVPLTVTIATAGQHLLQLKLPDDPLTGDNVRNLAATVRDRLDVTLLDGRIGPGAFESSSDFLQVVLSIGQEPWHALRISDTDPQAARPAMADLTCITDVAALSPAAIAQYESLVKSGMGLMIFAGEQIDPTLYNDRLYKNGNGLLPARISRVEDGPVKGMLVDKFADSPLAILSKLTPAALSRISTKRFLELDTTGKPIEGVRVLARWNDPEGHPAVIEKQLGRGKILLFTTTADREWTDWPVDKTYVLAVRTAALAIARPDRGDENITAGHELVVPPLDDQPKVNPRLTLPDDPTPIPIPTLKYPRTERAGTYTVLWNDASGHEQHHQLAVSFDRDASDLEPLSADRLAQLLGTLRAEVVTYHPGDLASNTNGHEIWRTLAATMLALLLVETCFAAYVGREK